MRACTSPTRSCSSTASSANGWSTAWPTATPSTTPRSPRDPLTPRSPSDDATDQISDCHLHADPGARARAGFPLRQLEAVVAAVNGERPDMVLVTGDISNDETAASYQLAARTLNRLAAPWFWLPGNHDDAALMAETRELLEELDCGAWRILMLDTTVSGQLHGELGAERLEALSARLEEDDRPTLLAMHHPPLPVGSA